MSIFRVRPTARASRSPRASSTRRRWRSTRRHALRVEPVRGRRLSRRRGRQRRAVRDRPRRRVRAGVRAATARCSSAIARARSSASTRRAGDARSRRCRRAWRRFTSRIGPDGGLYVTAPTLSLVRSDLPRRSPTATVDACIRRRSAGRRASRSTPTASLLRRRGARRRRAGCIASALGRSRPNWCVVGPRTGRRRLRARRRPRRLRSNDTAYRFALPAPCFGDEAVTCNPPDLCRSSSQRKPIAELHVGDRCARAD